MIHWYTGQPGHGKTLNALAYAMKLRDQGRVVYVCNVRGFDYQKAGMLEMTPEQFRDWMNFLPDGAVALVDEAYEHGMLPKRPPAASVPAHVEQLAKHRHRGLDFIFVSQSADKQCDQFVQDLIERHIHVRRRFGTGFVHLRTFDRYERNPEKATPLTISRGRLPKAPMGLYKSTEMDTTERRIPWYFPALAVGLPALLIAMWYIFSSIETKLSGVDEAAQGAKFAGADGGANGASATVASTDASSRDTRPKDYATWLLPRIAGQPWTAPAYDGAQLPPKPPRIYCAASGYDGIESCTCLTEQGTAYLVDLNRCRFIARYGQYNPYIDAEQSEKSRLRDIQQENRLNRTRPDRFTGLDGDQQGDALSNVPAKGVASSQAFGSLAAYGDISLAPAGTISSDID